MANDSIDHMYIGRAGLSENIFVYDFLNRVRFAPSRKGLYALRKIEQLGPAIHLHGTGRSCPTIPFTAQFRAWLYTGIVVHEYHSADWGELTRTISIAGKLAFSKTYDVHLARRPHPKWTFEGRTNEERSFFEGLFSYLNPKDELTKMERVTNAILGSNQEMERGAKWL